MKRLMPLTSELLVRGVLTPDILSHSVANSSAKVLLDQEEHEYIIDGLSLDLARLILGMQEDEVAEDPRFTEIWETTRTGSELTTDPANDPTKLVLGLHGDEVPEDPRLAEVLESIHAELKHEIISRMTYGSEVPIGYDGQHLEDFLRPQVDIQCVKWAETMDNIHWDGQEGSFFFSCSIYNKSPEYMNTLILQPMAKQSTHITQLKVNVQSKVKRAAWAIWDGLDQIDTTCWECNMLCEAFVHTCTGCETAKYCGRECQLNAWHAGHNMACRSLPDSCDSLAISFDTIDSVHSGDPEFNEFQDLRLDVVADYHVFSSSVLLLELLRKIKVDTFVKGPSIRYFYDNMRRIQVDDWWILEEICVTEKTYSNLWRSLQSTIPPRDDFEPCKLIASLLCFDLVGFFFTTRENRKSSSKVGSGKASRVPDSA